jgi:hypothetical protein
MKERKPYEKPKVTKIPVQPEESLIMPCKADAGCSLVHDVGS